MVMMGKQRRINGIKTWYYVSYVLKYSFSKVSIKHHVAKLTFFFISIYILYQLLYAWIGKINTWEWWMEKHLNCCTKWKLMNWTCRLKFSLLSCFLTQYKVFPLHCVSTIKLWATSPERDPHESETKMKTKQNKTHFLSRYLI